MPQYIEHILVAREIFYYKNANEAYSFGIFSFNDNYNNNNNDDNDNDYNNNNNNHNNYNNDYWFKDISYWTLFQMNITQIRKINMCQKYQ